MTRAIVALFIAVTALSCCGDAEKLPPPLPKDGGVMPYAQVLARLSAQVNTAKDEHFLNHWDAVVEASVGLQQSADYLLRSPDLPPIHRVAIEKSSKELSADILKLRDTARKKEQSESLELIRRIHNKVRELQDLK